jgi:hypothetical protein
VKKHDCSNVDHFFYAKLQNGRTGKTSRSLNSAADGVLFRRPRIKFAIFSFDLSDHIAGTRNRTPVDASAPVGKRKVTGVVLMFI